MGSGLCTKDAKCLPPAAGHVSPHMSATCFYVPRRSHSLQEPFLRPIGRSSGPGILPWVVVCTQPCVCPLEWNLCFPQSVEFQQSSLTYIQSQMLWGPLLLAHTEEPSVGLDLSVLLENFYDTIILHPPGGMDLNISRVHPS